jgi:hypothetical protein
VTRYRVALRNSVASEARAFGFSLVVLVTAYLTIRYHGLPGAHGALVYLGGVLLGQITSAVAAFRSVRATWSSGENVEYHAWASVHLASPIAGALAGWGIAYAVHPRLAAFAAAGFGAVLVYELVLAGELAAAMTVPPDSAGHEDD